MDLSRVRAQILLAIFISAFGFFASLMESHPGFLIGLQFAVLLLLLQLVIGSFVASGKSTDVLKGAESSLNRIEDKVSLLHEASNAVMPSAARSGLPEIVKEALRASDITQRLRFSSKTLRITNWDVSETWYHEFWEELLAEQRRTPDEKIIVRITQDAEAAANPKGPWGSETTRSRFLGPQEEFCSEGGIILRAFVGPPIQDEKNEERLAELITDMLKAGIGAFRLDPGPRVRQRQRDFLWIQRPANLVVIWQYELGQVVSESVVTCEKSELKQVRLDWRDYAASDGISQRTLRLSDDQWTALRTVAPSLKPDKIRPQPNS